MQDCGAGDCHLEGEKEGLAAWSDNYLVCADIDLQLARVKVCDGLTEFGNAGAGQIALAGGVLNQRADDFRMGRKAGLAKS